MSGQNTSQNTVGTNNQHSEFPTVPECRRKAGCCAISNQHLVLTEAELEGREAPRKEDDRVVQPIMLLNNELNIP